MHLCLIDWGVHLSSIYMHCPRCSSRCSGMQGICAQLTREGHMKCNGIQGIYAQLTGGSICLLYICIVLDLAVGVVVCKASMLEWLGGPSAFYIYMHCPRCRSGCSSMQGICARLTGDNLCWIALCYANIFHVVVFNASVLSWLGWSICLLYICIVLDLTVGVVVFRASVLNWWGVHLPSMYMHCPRSSSGCSSMQDICAQLTGEGHMKCNSIQSIYAQLTGGPFAFYVYALS